MKTAMTAIAAAGALAFAVVSAPNDAQAQCRGCGLGFGILGGVVAGTIIGGAIARSAYPAYAVAPGYEPYVGYAATGPVSLYLTSGAESSAIRRRGSSAREASHVSFRLHSTPGGTGPNIHQKPVPLVYSTRQFAGPERSGSRSPFSRRWAWSADMPLERACMKTW
jgi:hypothetical protein